MYKLRYVKIKSLEWFKKNAISQDEFFIEGPQKYWGIYKTDAGKIVNIYRADYMAVYKDYVIEETSLPAYKELEFGIEEDLTKATNPEYYL